MTTPADQSGTPPTYDELDALTVDDLVAKYDVPKGKKADVITAVFDKLGVPQPKTGEVILAVNPVTSSEHYWKPGEDPIVPSGTPVPASEVEGIIAAAAAGGVKIYEVN